MSISKKARMHSAEHLLNQAMVRVVGTDRCFSAHINDKKSKCDYAFDRDLTEEEASAVAGEVNRAIEMNLDMIEEMMERDAAAKAFNIGRVPDDAGEKLRIVRMGDYDACPCIGEHVENTVQIGTFRMISHSFEDGVLRVRFKLSAPVSTA